MMRSLSIAVLLLAGGPAALEVRSAEPPKPPRLTLREAEETAVQKHPRITAAELQALAAKQVVKEVRSAFFPSVFGEVTAAGADQDNTRIAAGGFNSPRIFDRNAEGVLISQLITDFGRTANLTASSKSKARAQAENALATREQILLAVNNAYFAALKAQAVQAVARQTVDSRQLVLKQVQTLATNKLKSELDVSFATVDVSDAQLLLAKADVDVNSSFAYLSTVLGYREYHLFELVEEPMPTPQSNDVFVLTAQALRQRPELLQLRDEREAAAQFAKAEKRLILPSINAVAGAGVVPIRDPQLNHEYAAAGVNLAFPLFTGGLYKARRSEAEYRADAAVQLLRDQENNIIRDVRVAKLNVDYALQKLGLAEQLLANARKTLELAQVKYKSQLGSIVELSVAQLNETSAQITRANAQYDYLLQRAVLDFTIGALR